MVEANIMKIDKSYAKHGLTGFEGWTTDALRLIAIAVIVNLFCTAIILCEVLK